MRETRFAFETDCRHAVIRVIVSWKNRTRSHAVADQEDPMHDVRARLRSRELTDLDSCLPERSHGLRRWKIGDAQCAGGEAIDIRILLGAGGGGKLVADFFERHHECRPILFGRWRSMRGGGQDQRAAGTEKKKITPVD